MQDSNIDAPTLLDQVVLEKSVAEWENKYLKSERKRYNLKKSYMNYIKTLERTNNELNRLVDDLQDQITVMRDFIHE